jgi:predicted transposase YbfD/YdcC
MSLSEEFLIHFNTLEDPRLPDRNFRHKLSDILTITIIATICGADNWVEISNFGRCRYQWFLGFLELPHGIPSHDTFSRVFAALDSSKFELCFIEWAKSLERIFSKDNFKKHIAIDGKTSRRSHNRNKGQNPLHLVSAWASDCGLLLGQVKTEEKSNEIEAIPRLLNMINIKNSLITIDAMGCQRTIAKNIIEQKGDYILSLKGNQPTLSENVRSIFTLAKTADFKNMHNVRKTEKVKNHGRMEKRRYSLISCKDKWSFDVRWPGMRSLGMVEVKRTVNNITTKHTRYFLTSLTYENIDDFMRGVRKHWDIEINLHWSLDVSFNDDLNRSRIGNSQENLSIIKRIALNLLKQDKSTKVGITVKRKKAGWDNEYLKKIIGV